MTGYDLVRRITDPKEAAGLIYELAHFAKSKEEFIRMFSDEMADESIQNIITEASRHGKGYPIFLDGFSDEEKNALQSIDESLKHILKILLKKTESEPIDFLRPQDAQQ